MKTSYERNREIARAIGAATSTCELRKAYAPIMRKRATGHAVSGPEFAGCVNSGARARIVIGAHGKGYMVATGIGNEDRKFYSDAERGAALADFYRRCMKAVRFNLKSRTEIRDARAALNAGMAANPERYMAALLTLGDHGLMVGVA